MNRKIMLLATIVLVVIVSLTVVVYLHIRFQEEVAEESWLKSGIYMMYEQFFVWNGYSKTDYMTWNVTNLGNDFGDLSLISHGVNITGKNVVLTLGKANFTMNVATREIVDCSDLNYLGKKWPFWIQANVSIGSTIDILYGRNIISKSEPIYVLGKQRDCWVVEYNWTTSSMKRWYDKSSGICLKIHVVLFKQGITIQITETAVLTNVNLKS